MAPTDEASPNRPSGCVRCSLVCISRYL